MLRLAVGLVDRTGSAEDVAQDAFAAAQLRTGASDGPIRKGSVVKIQTNGSTVIDVFGEYEKK